jgi:hypothetical protein
MYDTAHVEAVPEPHHVDFEVSVVNVKKSFRACVVAPDKSEHAVFIYDDQGKRLEESGDVSQGTIEEGVIFALRIILAVAGVPERVT